MAVSWSWQERPVNPGREHLVLSHGDSEDAVATVGPPEGRVFPVQFVAPESPENASMRHDVRRELDYYLVELGEPDPWRYAIYHCGTTANVYSRVHWSYVASAEN